VGTPVVAPHRIRAYRSPKIGHPAEKCPGEDTVNKAQLVEALSARLGEDKKRTAATVEALLDTVYRAVQKGERVALTGFGVFEKRERAARTARNPATGEKVKVKKTSVPAFRAGQEFKNVVNGSKKLPKVAPAAAAKSTSTRTAAAGTATKATSARSAAAKSPAAKAPAKSTATRTAAKSTAAKSTATKAAAKSTATKAAAKSTASKAPAKKASAAKTLASKSAPAAKKASAAKTLASKAPAKKAAAKSTARKSTRS
jgi:DNA-binding protein HU-beta